MSRNKGSMYNFLEFIDSPDIRNFNKDTLFTPAEQAILVAKSRKRTVEEKIDALQHLVDYYSEDEFQKDICKIGNYCEETDGKLRDCIVKTITLWNQILHDRTNADGYVYAAHINEKDFVREDLSEYCFFFSYEKAFEFIQKEKKSYLDDEDLKRVETFGKIYRLKVDEVYGRYNPYDEFFFDGEMRLVDIWRYPPVVNDTELEEYNVFVPLPFEVGDIVKVHSPLWADYYGVISHNRSYRTSLLTMMTSIDVYDEKSGKFDYTDDTDILEMEFCTEEELPEDQKVLKVIRDIRKGDMDFYTLLYLYGQNDLDRLINRK